MFPQLYRERITLTIVQQLKNILRSWQVLHDFTLIYNDNIDAKCLAADRHHLSRWGKEKLSANFSKALNNLHIWRAPPCLHPLNKDNNYHDNVILNQVSDKLQLPKSFYIVEKSSTINNLVETSIFKISDALFSINYSKLY